MLCAVSQFICHISTVRYRTVQFSMKTVPDGDCSSVHSNKAVYLCNYLVQLLCAVSQFICHISTVQYVDCARR